MAKYLHTLDTLEKYWYQNSAHGCDIEIHVLKKRRVAQGESATLTR